VTGEESETIPENLYLNKGMISFRIKVEKEENAGTSNHHLWKSNPHQES
jgi:hypothetical protein